MREKVIDLVDAVEDGARQWAVRTLGTERVFLAEHRARNLLSACTWRVRGVDRPIFAWGAGRTGSYLLYDLLSLHPDVGCLRARRRLARGLYGSMHHGETDYDAVKNPFPPIEGGRRHVFGPRPHLLDDDRFAPTDVRAVREAFRRLGSKSLLRSRILDKDPHYTFLTELLHQAFPDALHIHCVRHPHVTARSYARRMKEPGALDEHGFWGWKPKGWQTFEGQPLNRRAAWLTAATMETGLANERRLGSRCLRVRYEDLVRAPRRILEEAIRFCELQPRPGLLAEIPAEFPDYGKGFDRFDVEEDLGVRLDAATEALGYA